MRQLDQITDSMDASLSKLGETVRTGRPGVLQFIGSQRVRHDLVTEQQLKYDLSFRSKENDKV